jgi:hypothetical protein
MGKVVRQESGGDGLVNVIHLRVFQTPDLLPDPSAEPSCRVAQRHFDKPVARVDRRPGPRVGGRKCAQRLGPRIVRLEHKELVRRVEKQ